MISGTVNSNREAILRLEVRDVHGRETVCKAIIDTGFDGWLSLPSDFIVALGLRWLRFGRAILADGSETVFNIHRGTILWDGLARTILIYEMEAEPLIGMSLMHGYELVLPVFEGATFSLRKIDNQ